MNGHSRPRVTKHAWHPIARYRLLAGYTQAEVEKTLGVSHHVYSQWENGRGKPNATNLIALANLYGCNPAKLIEEAVQ